MKTEINPHLLDLVMRDNDYVIFHGSNPLLTAGGNEVSHKNPRLLQHLIFEMTLDKIVAADNLSADAIFSEQKDRIGKNIDSAFQNFDELLEQDYFIKLKIKGVKPTSSEDIDSILDFYEKNRFVLNLTLGATANMQNLINDFLIAEGFKDIQSIKSSPEILFKFLKEQYTSFSTEEKSALNILIRVHNCGITLALMLAANEISASEYAISLVNQLISVNPELREHPELSFKVIYNDAKTVSEYLFYSKSINGTESKTKGIINGGENLNTEFKSTFRWNLKAGKKDPSVEHASLKTIAAFLNSSGGHLLIGVRDDGSIEGIETDKFENDDKFLLHLWQMIGETIGDDLSGYIKTNMEKLDGKTICTVQCFRSPTPVFLKHKGFDEEFFIRVGPGSAKLTISDAMKYIGDRFKS